MTAEDMLILCGFIECVLTILYGIFYAIYLPPIFERPVIMKICGVLFVMMAAVAIAAVILGIIVIVN